MKTFIFILCALMCMWTARALATAPSYQATLVYASGRCVGEWYFGRTPADRIYWTGGDRCAATYQECLHGVVLDNRGSARKVLSCSPDSQLSRGRKATYK